MIRWLLTSLLVVAMTAWAWLAHGLLWDVKPTPARLISTPWLGAEPFSFGRTLGESDAVTFLDSRRERHVARAIGTGAVDAALVAPSELFGDAFAGFDVTVVALIEHPPADVRLLVVRPGPGGISAGATVIANWARSLERVGAQPEAFGRHLAARGIAGDTAGLRLIEDPSAVATALRAQARSTGISDVEADALVARLLGRSP